MKEPSALVKYGDAPEVGQEQTLDIYVEEESDSMGSTEVMRTGLTMERRGWTPDAMGVRVLGKIRRRAGDEVWVQAVLEALHEEYLEQWESQVGTLQEQLQKAESETHIWDSETETGKFNDAAFKRQYELRAQTMEITASVDGRFFENLILVMPDEAAESMRVLRSGAYVRS